MRNARLAVRTMLVVGVLGAAVAGAAPAGSDAPTALDMAVLINSERAARGIPAVAVEPVLVAEAQDRARRMAESRRLFHTPSLPEWAGPWQSWGENVGRGSTLGSVHAAFMGSARHAANVLSASFSGVGIGVAWADDRMYIAQVYVERPGGYRASRLVAGGGATEALTVLSPTWYFAEGATWPGFEEFIVMANPNPEPATVDVNFFDGAGHVGGGPMTIPAGGRSTMHVNAVVGQGDVATTVVADRPIAAMRTLFVSDGFVADGGMSAGAAAPALSWFFPDAYTGAGFKTFIALFNPSAGTSRVTLTYMGLDGAVGTSELTLPSGVRATVPVHDMIPGAEISIEVTATEPVVAERSQVVNAGGRRGFHTSLGSMTPSTSLQFAEGYTGAGFSEYIVVQNPSGQAATATVTLMAGGDPVVIDLAVAARGRATVDVNAVVGEGREVGAAIDAPTAVVAERVQYFRTSEYVGSSSAMGSPVSAWSILPEGYNAPGFRTYVLISNPSPEPTTVWVTYLTESGPVARTPIDLPAWTRTTIDTSADQAGSFGVEVAASRPVSVEGAEYYQRGI